MRRLLITIAGRRLRLALSAGLIGAALITAVTRATTQGVAVGLALLCASVAVVLVAAGAGRALKLVVAVQGSHAAATEYLAARLRAMGSTPPSGLRIPRGPDVTELPKNALTSLLSTG